MEDPKQRYNLNFIIQSKSVKIFGVQRKPNFHKYNKLPSPQLWSFSIFLMGFLKRSSSSEAAQAPAKSKIWFSFILSKNCSDEDWILDAAYKEAIPPPFDLIRKHYFNRKQVWVVKRSYESCHKINFIRDFCKKVKILETDVISNFRIDIGDRDVRRCCDGIPNSLTKEWKITYNKFPNIYISEILGSIIKIVRVSLKFARRCKIS